MSDSAGATAIATRARATARTAPARTRFKLAEVDRKRLVSLALDGFTLCVTAVVFLVLNKPFYANYPGYDEEFFTWGGWCITKGLTLYKDFLEFKPPVSFITHAIAIGLFGLKHYGYRTFFAIWPLAAVLLLQAALLARRVERFITLATIVGFVALFLNTGYHDTALTDCESIGVTYYTLGLAAFLWQGAASDLVVGAGGFFMSCAVLSKEPIGGVVAVTWFGSFFLRNVASVAEAKRFARSSLLGIAAFFLLLCLYMVPTGAMSAYIDLIHSYQRIYRDPKSSYCVAVGANPDASFDAAWRHIRQVFFNESTLGYLAPLALPGAVFALRRSFWLFVSVLAATAAGLWASVPTLCMWIHYCVMSMAGVLYVLVVSLDSLKIPLASAPRRVRVGVSAVACVAIAAYVWPTFDQFSRAKFQRIPWQEPQPGLLHFIAAHTTPADRIFTTGTPQLYAQADRVSALRETNIIDEILPSYEGETDEERLRPLKRELVEHRPVVVFIDPEHESRKERHLRTLVFPFLEQFHYRKINDRLYLRP